MTLRTNFVLRSHQCELVMYFAVALVFYAVAFHGDSSTKFYRIHKRRSVIRTRRLNNTSAARVLCSVLFHLAQATKCVSARAGTA